MELGYALVNTYCTPRARISLQSVQASTKGLSPGKHTFFALLVDDQHAPVKPSGYRSDRSRRPVKAEAPSGPIRAGRFARLATVVAGAVIVAAGCGAGGSTPGVTLAPPSSASPNTTPATGSPVSGSTITISLKEFSITPATLTIKAGTAITFEARNEGTISHSLVISGNGVNLPTKDLAFEPGTTETIAATLGAGTYTFICPVDGHAARGMKGTITVTP